MGIKALAKIHKPANTQTSTQQVGAHFQALKKTIDEAAPVIEYAVDLVQARLVKINFHFLANVIINLF